MTGIRDRRTEVKRATTMAVCDVLLYGWRGTHGQWYAMMDTVWSELT